MMLYKNLEKLEVTGKYLIALLAAVINESEVPMLYSGISWNDVYYMAKMHNVESMAFYGAKSYLSDDSELYSIWKKRKDQNLIQSIVQLEERDELFKSFFKSGIRFLPLKGCEFKELYKQIDFRQMADLDILIDEENATAVKTVMESLGYEAYEVGEKYDDKYHKFPYMNVEIHKRMFSNDISNYAYYDNIWNIAIPNINIPGGWKLASEDFYIYHLAHLAKHYNERGAGIRFLMDIYVYLQLFNEKLDKDYIYKELKSLKLYKFSKIMEELSYYWFAPTNNEHKFSDKSILSEIQTNIFYAGAYGSREFIKARNMENIKIENGILPCMKYIWKRIFMSKEEFGYVYPITNKYPILICFFWFYRIFDVVLYKRNALVKELELFHIKRNKNKYE